jgi:hypothetical protein
MGFGVVVFSERRRKSECGSVEVCYKKNRPAIRGTVF